MWVELQGAVSGLLRSWLLGDLDGLVGAQFCAAASHTLSKATVNPEDSPLKEATNSFIQQQALFLSLPLTTM